MKALKWMTVLAVMGFLWMVGREDAGNRGRAWFEGGTLHRVSAVNFRNGEYRDKLATAADWATTTRPKPRTLGEMERRARSIMECVDHAATQSVSMDAAEMAAACIVILGLRPSGG